MAVSSGESTSIATTEEAQLCHLAAQVALEDAGYHELPGDFWARPTEDPAAWSQTSLPSQSNSLALGAGAYGYYPGVQYFNEFSFARYGEAIATDRVPIWRAAVLTPAQELARELDPELATALASVGDVRASVSGKRSTGSTAPAEVERQIAALRQAATEARDAAATVPRLAQLLATISGTTR